MTDKEKSLRDLKQETEEDASLPLRESNLVFGEGDPNCKAMFIGEGPGYHEDKLKRPFVGRAGQLLDELILRIGWKRKDVYITNIIKRRPPENRDPLPEEIAAYAPYLTREIEIVNPPVIAALGRFAMNYFLPDAKISRDQGKAFLVGERVVVPLFHPAAALRSTGVLEELKKSFSKLPDIISGRTSVEKPFSSESVSVKPEKRTNPVKQSKLF
ncbi:uracil-DNA glycosylase [Candidatus Parcubacteria bacterium]|nr:MAG: uracil-DNA glycosylase [Candidatus Parcubacteria bacterium]